MFSIKIAVHVLTDIINQCLFVIEFTGNGSRDICAVFCYTRLPNFRIVHPTLYLK